MFHVPFQLSAQFQTSGADADSCEGLPQRPKQITGVGRVGRILRIVRFKNIMFPIKMAICG